MITEPILAPQDCDALVLLSGGQDSTTCLAWALSIYNAVEAISFDYGQRHLVELEVAADIAEHFGVQHTVLRVPALAEIGAAALTNPDIAVSADAAGTGNEFAAAQGLPSTFVPARNAVLLSTAAAYALPNELQHLVIGICEADDAGYPDCRGVFAEVMESALRLALDYPRFLLAAPLLHLDKAHTFALADRLDALSTVLEMSHTCYEGEHETRHAWGYGCGRCPACLTRARGWAEFQGLPA